MAFDLLSQTNKLSRFIMNLIKSQILRNLALFLADKDQIKVFMVFFFFFAKLPYVNFESLNVKLVCKVAV